MIVQKELFGEGKHVEFKAEIPKKHEKFLKDIIAFANTSGGKTIIGVEDGTGEVLGLGNQNPFKLSDAISNMISDACTPQIDTEITAKTVMGETILEVEVFPGVNRPYYLKSSGKETSAYIRINGTSRPAGEIRLKELEMEGMHVSFDTLWEIGQKYDEDAVQTLMDSMYRTAVSNSRTPEEREAVHKLTVGKLEDFGLLRRQDGEYVPTRAFTLLTGPKMRYVKTQCALFKGKDRVDFIDRKEFRGPIQEQIEEAYQFVLRHTNKGAVIEGLYRQDVYELPIGSIREIITNTALHRSYADEAAVQVSIFDDRLEIDSPGMLYAGLSRTEAMSGKSKCRNKAIAEAFQYMKIIEGWGTGLPRLFRRCEEMGLPEPKFEEFGDGIKVTVYRSIGGTRIGINDANNPKIKANEANSEANEANYDSNDANNKEGASNRVVTEENVFGKIIRCIQNNPRISQQALAKNIGVSRSTIQRQMSQLMKTGQIRREGGTRGTWMIQEKT